MLNNYRSVIENGIVTLYSQSENSPEMIVASLPVTSILDRVNGGEWDNQSELALQLLMAWLTTHPEGQPVEDIRFFRWVVAHVWISEQREKHHGKAIFKLENSPIVLPLYLSSECSALANNVEGTLIERFGHEQGVKNAAIFYQQMLEGSPEQGLSLSDFGREVLFELHRSFIEEGLPQMAVNKPRMMH
ncbi:MULTISPECIES: hypothetical protein [Xenorhabdus]|uniref:Uncharacterized protein n=1 Tax=Xenorhabdus ehlersii TaxID=290111 RepID=A0A2D0IL77_9GAMM|nr:MULTISPECIES: hypothetical protein [Xenorhabdus]MBC8948412.1 hypothetical protein [Xenorhabdus sp. TS4]PHM22464.1 hypothetical protein Xehl_03610 [Xenorhabdus ehlersii]RKE88702.1 hypothetical protein BDE27_3354 [Xenorhabdus ehlersii]